jgi:hypothetical protein
MISFTNKVVVPETVLFRELEGGAVLPNLKTESYLSLDDVDTRMWRLFSTEPSIQAAYEKLLAEYDVAAEVLCRDVETLLAQMMEHGLVELKDG